MFTEHFRRKYIYIRASIPHCSAAKLEKTLTDPGHLKLKTEKLQYLNNSIGLSPKGILLKVAGCTPKALLNQNHNSY